MSSKQGTLEELTDVLAALFSEAFTRDFALGESGLRPARLVELLRSRLPLPYQLEAGRAPARNLDHYIEAQVHGDVSLARDVELLVADPSFRATATGDVLRALSERYAIPLHWHDGFWLAPEEVPSDFRGSSMPPLATRVARSSEAGRVDAAAIGEAARALKRDPASWSDAAGIAPLQQLKLLWHVLVRFGHSH